MTNQTNPRLKEDVDKALSGTLHKAIVHPGNATVDAEDSANASYINSAALDHLIPS